MKSNFGTKRRAVRALCMCTGLAIALFANGCGDDDDDDNPMNPDLTGPEAVEASSGIAISTVKSLETLFSTGSDPTGGGRGKMSEMKPLDLAWALVRARYDAAAKLDPQLAALAACTGGGTADSSCIVVSGVSAGTLSFDECRFQEDATTVTLDGTIALGVDDTSFCTTGEFSETASMSLGLNDFSVTVRNLQGVQLARFAADLTMEVDNDGPGCYGNDASVMLDGTLDVTALGDGVDAEITADNLSMSVNSTSTVGLCVVTMVVDGGLSVTDRAGEREMQVSYNDLELEFTELPNQQVNFEINGALNNHGCLGNISFETIEPLTFVGSAVCPISGAIEVTLSDNSKGVISFLPDGSIAFDYDANGSVDITLDSCHDDEINDCDVAAR